MQPMSTETDSNKINYTSTRQEFFPLSDAGPFQTIDGKFSYIWTKMDTDVC